LKLIIAEKPSVAFAIAKALDVKGSKDGYIENKNFIISWCVGHLVALAEPSVYDEKYTKWNYADLPIIPAEFQNLRRQAKAIQGGKKPDEPQRCNRGCQRLRRGARRRAYLPSGV